MKKIEQNDVIKTSFTAHKEYIREYDKLPNVCNEQVSNSDIQIYTGKKLSGDFILENEPRTNGQYQRSVYDVINKLYYHQYDGIDIKVNSYVELDNNVDLIKQFPTQVGSIIRVINIPQTIYGQRLRPNYFHLMSDLYNVQDDGNGNLIEINTNQLIGNIFYKEGICVITNQDFFCIFPIEPTIFPKKFSFYKNESKSISLLSDSIAYCNAVVDSNTIEILDVSDGFNYILSGDTLNFTNNSVGTYNARYYVKDSYGICSNIESIDVTILENCDFDLTIPTVTYQNNDCLTTIADYDIVKISDKIDFELSNNILVSLSDVTKTSTRLNGISDYNIKLDFNNNYTILYSKDGGLSYYTISNSASSILINTSTQNPIIYLRNSFLFNIKIKNATNESFVEYRFKLNPINGEYEFDKIRDYIDLSQYQSSDFHYNEYKVVTNGCDITGIDWSFTGEMSGNVVSKDTIQVYGCKGDVIAQIHSRCCPTVTKTLTFNGNCIEPTCDDSKIELELYSTNTKNNYIVFANINFYLKEYPSWQFFGGVKFLSDINSNYLEIQVDESINNSRLMYSTKDFCRTLTSELTFSRIIQENFTTSTTTSTTTIPISDDEIEYSDLELSMYTSNLFPRSGDTVDLSVLIQNKGNVNATNLIIELNPDSSFTIDPNSLISYTYYTSSGKYYFTRGVLMVGESFIIKLKGRFTANLGDIKYISSQVYAVDQLDPDSIPNNTVNEDDNSILKYTITNISSTTTEFDCKPIIRDYPYTNFICSVSNDNRGSIIINAINPITLDSSGLEYSFNGDIDVNYTSNNQSNLLPNGLYMVWVRLAINRTCKTSTMVRISCLNGQPETSWQLIGNVCSQ